MGRIRATTNQVRIGDPATGTQIREQSESNLCADRRTGPHDRRFVVAPFLSRPGWTRSIVRRGRKASANQSLAESPTATDLCRTRRTSSSLVAETLPPLEPPWPNPGPGRRDQGQTGSESATRRFTRFGARKATAIGAPAGAKSGHGAQRVKIGRRRPVRSQSIIAALRMQTMVACAGFSLRFLMRWGISQR
jgi:hypothetical protein